MTDFYANFSSFEKGGLSAEQYFYTQTYEAFKSNAENNRKADTGKERPD